MLAPGRLDGMQYDADYFGIVLSGYSTPFSVVWNAALDVIGQDEKGKDQYRLTNWFSIESACGEVLSAGGFPDELTADAVCGHFNELRERHLDRGHVRGLIEEFYSFKGIPKPAYVPAPDWYAGFTEKRWG